ncbi:MAG: hypothetical protein JXQ27_16345 [Acidobacteria bacterium]|nr:hypothetical protein [Acidobacteriota bacterium]
MEEACFLAARCEVSPVRIRDETGRETPLLPPGSCGLEPASDGGICLCVPALGLCWAVDDCRPAGESGWEIVSRGRLLWMEFGEDAADCPPGEMSLPQRRRHYDARLRHLLQRRLGPLYRLERLSSGHDPFQRFPGRYSRLVFGGPTGGVAGLAMYPFQEHEEGTEFLTAALLWFHYCRQRRRRFDCRLLLFFPGEAALRVLRLLTLLDPRRVRVLPLRYDLVAGELERVNVERLLAGLALDSEFEFRPRRPLHENLPARDLHREFVADLVHEKTPHRFDLLTCRGLPLVHIHGPTPADLFLGWSPPYIPWADWTDAHRRDWLREVIAIRREPSPAAHHPAFRLYGERWLESLVVGHIRRFHKAFLPQWTYRQVPTYRGTGRAVLDVLTLQADGRLAVLEIKTTESRRLLFQALDYWERVRDGAAGGAFQRAGYFLGQRLAGGCPELYLVAPLFRLHKHLAVIHHYLRSGIPIHTVEVNLNWRRHLRVVRHELLR